MELSKKIKESESRLKLVIQHDHSRPAQTIKVTAFIMILRVKIILKKYYNRY